MSEGNFGINAPITADITQFDVSTGYISVEVTTTTYASAGLGSSYGVSANMECAGIPWQTTDTEILRLLGIKITSTPAPITPTSSSISITTSTTSISSSSSNSTIVPAKGISKGAIGGVAVGVIIGAFLFLGGIIFF